MADQNSVKPRETQTSERPGAAPGTYGGYGSFGGYGAYGAYGGYGSYGGGQGEVEAHLMDYLRTVYRRRWTAVSAFAVVLMSVAIYTFTVVPEFEARVQLLIEPDNPNVVSFKEVIQQEQTATEYYQTQYSILKSRALARRTLQALSLWDNPEFGGGPAKQESFSVMGALGGAVQWVAGLVTGGSKEAAAIPGANESAAQSRTIDGFLLNLTVTPIRNSRLVDVRFASPDPVLAAKITNTLAQQYIQQILEYKFLSSKEASDWLGAQLADQRKKLEDSELALQKYREKGDAVALEDRQNIIVQRLTDLNSALTKARTDRIDKEARYQQLLALQNDRKALDTFPTILANSYIQQLKSELAQLQQQQVQMAERLGEKHRDMIKLSSAIETTEARLKEEIGKVVQSVKNEYLSAQSQERSLGADLERQKVDALGLNRKGIEYGVLRREAESNKQIYDSLTQRSKETGISGELKTSNIRVVDQAETPRRPIRPRKSTNLLLGFLGGAMAGIGLAFFFEYMDHRIKNPDEIKYYLGLTFLGLIPSVDLEHVDGQSLPSAVPASFNEAFRSIRTQVIFSMAEEGSRSIVVTSSQPGEGKTLVASNLAMSLAQTGKRVLLVDADMRKPRQHDMFQVTREPGLSNLLVGQATAADAVRKTSAKGLHLLPAGALPPNPAELLGSSRFAELLKGLGEHFDWIVIDSPPVLAVTDAVVVAHRTNGVLYVVGSEQIDRQMAARAVEKIQAAKGHIIGAVLNRVNVDRNPYYYSHYYRKDYSDYYTSSETKT